MSGLLGGAFSGALGGGSIGRAVVQLVLDTTGYNAQLDEAQAKTTAVTEQQGAATSTFSGVAAAGYAIAGAAAVGFAASAISAASEHQQVLAALTAQVGDNTQAFQDQAAALQNLTGFEDEAILSADTILSRFKLTDAQVRASIPTVLDYARATGKSVPDAASAVGKALLGNTRALKAVGIAYTSTGNATQDFNNILDLLNQKVGGQAIAYADTYAGKIDILSAKFNDLKEAIGAPLIDEISKLADSLNNVSIAASEGTGQTNILGQATKDLLVTYNPLVVLTHANEAYLNAVAKAAGVNTDATNQMAAATTQAAAVTKSWGDGLTTAAEAQAKLATETRKATQAQEAQRLAQLQAAGGLLGLVSSLQTAKQDQATINKLQAEGKTNTQAYRDAVVQATTDVLAFRTAVRQYVADNPNRSLSQTRDALREMATQAGITGQQFRSALGGPLKDIIAQLDNLQSKRVAVQIDSTSIDAAAQKLHGLQQALARGL